MSWRDEMDDEWMLRKEREAWMDEQAAIRREQEKELAEKLAKEQPQMVGDWEYYGDRLLTEEEITNGKLAPKWMLEDNEYY